MSSEPVICNWTQWERVCVQCTDKEVRMDDGSCPPRSSSIFSLSHTHSGLGLSQINQQTQLLQFSSLCSGEMSFDSRHIISSHSEPWQCQREGSTELNLWENKSLNIHIYLFYITVSLHFHCPWKIVQKKHFYIAIMCTDIWCHLKCMMRMIQYDHFKITTIVCSANQVVCRTHYNSLRASGCDE